VARQGMPAKAFAELRHVAIPSAGTGHEAAIERAFAERRQRRRIALTIPHFMAVPIIVAQSDCIVTVPRRLARAFEGYPGLRTIAPAIPMEPFEIRQHWHERYHHDPANKWIRGLVAELFLE
jgi:DNA-binding transcriptional LysR family regulator